MFLFHNLLWWAAIFLTVLVDNNQLSKYMLLGNPNSLAILSFAGIPLFRLL